jgi:hypothetical protein
MHSPELPLERAWTGRPGRRGRSDSGVVLPGVGDLGPLHPLPSEVREVLPRACFPRRSQDMVHLPYIVIIAISAGLTRCGRCRSKIASTATFAADIATIAVGTSARTTFETDFKAAVVSILHYRPSCLGPRLVVLLLFKIVSNHLGFCRPPGWAHTPRLATSPSIPSPRVCSDPGRIPSALES